jgi:hypothetical protein
MALDDWVSYHLFYQGSRDRLLTGLVRPLAADLWREGRIDRFFFVRYALGGPHLRVRFRVVPSHGGDVEAGVEAACEEFFRHFPSETTLTEAEIRRTNRSLIANDPEAQDVLHPNNSWTQVPFQGETERYGGEELLGHSLDFFNVSSLRVLRFLTDGEVTWSAQSRFALLLFTRHALGLARDPEEFLDLISQPIISWGEHTPTILSHGDQVFERQRDHFVRLLRDEAEALTPYSSQEDTESARRLAWEVRDAAPALRRSIAVGQLHMTANRLGFTNAQEVYLSRILYRTAEELAPSDPALWSRLRDLLATRAALSIPSGERLRNLLPAVFAEAFTAPGEVAPA